MGHKGVRVGKTAKSRRFQRDGRATSTTVKVNNHAQVRHLGEVLAAWWISMDLGQHELYSQLSQEKPLKDLIPNGEQHV